MRWDEAATRPARHIPSTIRLRARAPGTGDELIYFSVNQPITLTRHQLRQSLAPASAAGQKLAYVTSAYDFMDLQRRASRAGIQPFKVLNEEAILSSPGAPVELGVSNAKGSTQFLGRSRNEAVPIPLRPLESCLSALKSRESPRLAIINGFGTGIGDYVVGLTAWRITRERLLRAGCKDVSAEIWARTHAFPKARVVCAGEPSLVALRPLPIELDLFLKLDGFWDLSGMLDRPAFKEMPMIDFLLFSLGVDPASVDLKSKRNQVRIPPLVQMEVDAALRRLSRPFVLLHSASSTPLRDMPEVVIRRLVRELGQRSQFAVASMHRLPVPEERYVDLSHLFRSHKHFCAVIRRAAGLLTVDTCTYHIADAFGIPTLVVFTTVPPERWIPYYPTVEAVTLEGVRQSEYFGLHRSNDRETLAEIHELWSKMDLGQLSDRFMGLVASADAVGDV